MWKKFLWCCRFSDGHKLQGYADPDPTSFWYYFENLVPLCNLKYSKFLSKFLSCCRNPYQNDISSNADLILNTRLFCVLSEFSWLRLKNTTYFRNPGNFHESSWDDCVFDIFAQIYTSRLKNFLNCSTKKFISDNSTIKFIV